MTTLAHLSDLHVLDLEGVPLRRYVGKRATGLVSLALGRRRAHSSEVLGSLVQDLLARPADHVVVTGDLTNLSLEPELAKARSLLEPLASGGRLSVIPGNHDVYTKDAARERTFERYFGDLMGDPAPGADGSRYPWHRRVAGLDLVGLSSAEPRPLLLAGGRVDPRQLDRLRELSRSQGLHERFTVGLVHHNLHRRGLRKDLMHGLSNRDEVLEACARAGIDLLLHGHTHVAHRFRHGAMRVVGCGSSTWTSTDPGHVARYNAYHIEEGALSRVEVRVWDPRTSRFLTREHIPAAAI